MNLLVRGVLPIKCYPLIHDTHKKHTPAQIYNIYFQLLQPSVASDTEEEVIVWRGEKYLPTPTLEAGNSLIVGHMIKIMPNS